MNLTRDEAIDVVDNIRYLIVSMGGMATKPIIEKILQARWTDLDDSQARDLTNGAEYSNRRVFRLNPLQWTAA